MFTTGYQLMKGALNRNLRLQLYIADYAVIFLANPVKCFRRFIRSQWGKQPSPAEFTGKGDEAK